MGPLTTAKRRVLEKLAEQDWTPTDLAEELNTSTPNIYNHLHDLAERGMLQTEQVPATTRPKTQYSIGRGFVRYLAVLPGQVQSGAWQFDQHKGPLLRIWLLPQPEFHPFLTEYWRRLRRDHDLEEEIRAVGVFGSVARGHADAQSDIDVFILATDDNAVQLVEEQAGAMRIQIDEESRIVVAEVFSFEEYRESWDHDSHFLREVVADIHPVYDPDRLFDRPGALPEDRTSEEAIPREQ